MWVCPSKVVVGRTSGEIAGGPSWVPVSIAALCRLRRSAVSAFAKQHLSTVDDLDTEAGRLALVLLLGGAAPGQYGVRKTAADGVLPQIPLVTTGG